MLFCKYYEHSIDYVRIDTIKGHLKSKKNASRKEAKLAKVGASSTALNATLHGQPVLITADETTDG